MAVALAGKWILWIDCRRHIEWNIEWNDLTACAVSPMKTHLRPQHPIADYIRILERMGLLIERNGHVFQKGLLDNLVSRLTEGESREILLSNDIWGGSGSVTDCNLLSEGGPQPKESARIDELEFCSLVEDLAARMMSDGLATERVKQVGSVRAMWAKEPRNGS